MISYVAASNDRATLDANLRGSVRLAAGDELIVVENPPSLAAAYNQGGAEAANRLRCFVHHDVTVLDPRRLRAELVAACTPDVGMVGVVGSRDRVVPWWTGDRLGSVVDARLGVLDFGAGGPCAYLDGLLLATAQDVEWDESYQGFHLYDHDVCEQMLARGLRNHCLTGGAGLVAHNTTGPTDMRELRGWDAAAARFTAKWGRDA